MTGRVNHCHVSTDGTSFKIFDAPREGFSIRIGEFSYDKPGTKERLRDTAQITLRAWKGRSNPCIVSGEYDDECNPLLALGLRQKLPFGQMIAPNNLRLLHSVTGLPGERDQSGLECCE